MGGGGSTTSTTSQGMRDTGHHFEACFNDINGTRNQLKSLIESTPYKSQKAAPAFIKAMDDWDAQFDVLQRGLINMRDILVPQGERIELTEEDNVNIANFFNPGADKPVVTDGPSGVTTK